MLDFWLRVKDKLDFQDSTQRDLAQNINESYNTLQSWINRDRLPNAEQAVKIAEALNTSVEFLVTGKCFFAIGIPNYFQQNSNKFANGIPWNFHLQIA